MDTQNQHADNQRLRNAKLQKLTDLIDKGINPYPYSFNRDASAAELQEKYKELEAGNETEDAYSVAGRIMAMRNNGMFMDLMDSSGKIQIFCHKENIGETAFKELKLVDVGDIIGKTSLYGQWIVPVAVGRPDGADVHFRSYTQSVYHIHRIFAKYISKSCGFFMRYG